MSPLLIELDHVDIEEVYDQAGNPIEPTEEQRNYLLYYFRTFLSEQAEEKCYNDSWNID